MGGQQNIRAQQRGSPGIFRQVIVPADQNANFHSPRRIEDGEAIPPVYRRMFKGVQLAVDMPLAIRHTNDVGVI